MTARSCHGGTAPSSRRSCTRWNGVVPPTRTIRPVDAANPSMCARSRYSPGGSWLRVNCPRSSVTVLASVTPSAETIAPRKGAAGFVHDGAADGAGRRRGPAAARPRTLAARQDGARTRRCLALPPGPLRAPPPRRRRTPPKPQWSGVPWQLPPLKYTVCRACRRRIRRVRRPPHDRTVNATWRSSDRFETRSVTRIRSRYSPSGNPASGTPCPAITGCPDSGSNGGPRIAGLKRWGSVRLKYRSPGRADRPAGAPGRGPPGRLCSF